MATVRININGKKISKEVSDNTLLSDFLRDKLVFYLKEKNIGNSIHYATPVPLMTYYKKKYNTF